MGSEKWHYDCILPPLFCMLQKMATALTFGLEWVSLLSIKQAKVKE